MKVQNEEQMDRLSNQRSIFAKIEEGDTLVRVMSDIHAVKEHRIQVEGRYRFPVCPVENARMRRDMGEDVKDIPPCPLCELGYPVQTNYNCLIVEREREEFNKKGDKVRLGGQAFVLKKGPTLFKPIIGLLNDPNWGKNGDYDVVIKATGEGTKRRYTILPVAKDKSKPLSTAELASLDELVKEVDLEKMTTPNTYEKIKEIIGPDFPEHVQEENDRDIPF